MTTPNFSSENHPKATHSSDHKKKERTQEALSKSRIEMLEEELAAAQRELHEQSSLIDRLQATHADDLNALEFERDQIIESLMQSEERYRTHISATTAVIWHGDASGHFNVPQDSWRDYTGQAWPLQSEARWIEMIDRDCQSLFTREWKSKIEIGQAFEIECPIWSESSQEYRYCEINATPIFNDADTQEIYAWIGSVIDIHERKLAEGHILSTNALLTKTVAELQLSNTELERFVYLASHDLKEPLRGMQSLAQILLDLYTNQIDEDGQELLTLISEAGNRMQQLISDLHNYSRVKLTSNGTEQVNTDAILDKISIGLRALPERREYRIQRPNILPDLYCNPIHLQAVFHNLISNALKYGEREPAVIEVGLLPPKENGEENIFYVRDNGIGLQPENHELIFEMFKRLHVDDEYGGGTGAGLALVKKILEQYGGRIWVESTLGIGSTFYFTFNNQNKHADRADQADRATLTPGKAIK